MSSRPKDQGRDSVYAAERFAFEGSWLGTPLPYDQIVEYATRIVTHRVWVRLGGRSIRFEQATGVTSWCQAIGRVGFTPTTEPSTITHELAHALTFARHPGVAHHGPEWRGLHTLLTEIVWGPEAAGALDHAWVAFGFPVVRPGFEWAGRQLIDWT